MLKASRPVDSDRAHGYALPVAATATLGVLAIAYWRVAIFKLLIHTSAIDFRTYYEAAKSLRMGRDPYLSIAATAIHDPPAWIYCFGALTLMPIRQAIIVWNLIHVAALAMAGWLLARQSRAPALFVFLILFFAPVINNFDLGQSKIEILLLLVLVLYWIERGYDCAAGAALALASLWRIFPVLMLGYLAVRRKYRTLGWSVAWLATGTALTIALVGWTPCVNFLAGLRFFGHKALVENENNLCLAAVIVRNTGSYALAIFASIAILAMTTAVSVGEERHWRIFVLWIATAVVLLPLAWTYDTIFVLIPFASLAAAPVSVAVLALVAISYVTASAQTWLYLFGFSIFGARLTSVLYPLSVHAQWLAPVSGYLAVLVAIRDARRELADLRIQAAGTAGHTGYGRKFA
jgi:Glycosyltransferase family 87